MENIELIFVLLGGSTYANKKLMQENQRLK